MTQEQREEILRLARIAADASTKHHRMGYAQVPLDPEEAREQSAKYQLARAEAYEASGALQSYIATLAKPVSAEIREMANELIMAAQRAA